MNRAKSEYVPGGVSCLLTSQSASSKAETNTDLAKLFTSPPKQEKKKKSKKKQIPDARKNVVLPIVDSAREEKKDNDRKKKKRKSSSETLLAREAALVEEERPKKKKKVEMVQKKQDVKQDDSKKDARTLFLGNLNVETDKKKIKKLFRNFGQIESIRFRSAAAADLKIPKKVAIIKKEFHPKKSNINAYVVFKEEGSAVKALKLNSHVLDGMHIHVDLVENQKKHDHGKSIFVGNVPFDAQEEALREHFQECGAIENVRLIRDKKTGLGKGFGYILFHDKTAVTLALGMASTEQFQGRILRIARSTENPKVHATVPVKNKTTHTVSGNINNKPKKKFKEERSQGDVKSGKEKFSMNTSTGKDSFGTVAHVKKKKNISKKKHIKQKYEAKKKQNLGSYLINSNNLKGKINNQSQNVDVKSLNKHQRKKLKRKDQASIQKNGRSTGNKIFARNRLSKKMKKSH